MRVLAIVLSVVVTSLAAGDASAAKLRGIKDGAPSGGDVDLFAFTLRPAVDDGGAAMMMAASPLACLGLAIATGLTIGGVVLFAFTLIEMIDDDDAVEKGLPFTLLKLLGAATAMSVGIVWVVGASNKLSGDGGDGFALRRAPRKAVIDLRAERRPSSGTVGVPILTF